MEQTYWLLDAGIGAAIAKFDQAPDFSEHSIATDGSLKNYSGSVDIKVIQRNDKSVTMRITAKLQGRHEYSPHTQRSQVIVLDNHQSGQHKSTTNKSDEVTNDEHEN